AAAVIIASVSLLKKSPPVNVTQPPPVVVAPPAAPEPVDLTKLYFGPQERPLGYIYLTNDKERPKELTRNPFPAKSETELDHVAKFLDGYGLQNVSPSDLKQGYVAVWWGATFIALETPIAERLEKEVLGLKQPANRWTHRKGNLLALVYAGPAEHRSLFAELVGMAQQKLSLPVEP